MGNDNLNNGSAFFKHSKKAEWKNLNIKIVDPLSPSINQQNHHREQYTHIFLPMVVGLYPPLLMPENQTQKETVPLNKFELVWKMEGF